MQNARLASQSGAGLVDLCFPDDIMLRRMDRPRFEQCLATSLTAIKSHDLAQAQKSLEEALSLNYEDKRVVGLLKYVGFWRERQRYLVNIQDNLEKSHYLLQEWAHFQPFMQRVNLSDDEINYALRQLVFGQALNLMSVYNNEAGVREPEVLYLIGVCLKGLGNYDSARRFLESANTIRREAPAIMADLADAYALVGDSELAKVLFREAFFINPQEVRLETLESEMMVRLIQAVHETGYHGVQLLEWLPIYGQLLGVFSIKRELRAIEYGKLLQNIYNLEREYQEGMGDPTLSLPRLINKYFWLMDYYLRSQQDRKRVQEILLKIRSLAPTIYELYTK